MWWVWGIVSSSERGIWDLEPAFAGCGAAQYISQSPGELPQLHLWVMAATGPVDTTLGGAVKSWGFFPGPRVLCADLAGTCLVEIVSALQTPVLWSKPAWWGASKLPQHLQCYKKEVLCFEHTLLGSGAALGFASCRNKSSPC